MPAVHEALPLEVTHGCPQRPQACVGPPSPLRSKHLPPQQPTFLVGSSAPGHFLPHCFLILLGNGEGGWGGGEEDKRR